MATERTPILGERRGLPRYGNHNWNRPNCYPKCCYCICAALIMVIVGVIIATLFYYFDNKSNDTKDFNITSDVLNFYNMSWPLKDGTNASGEIIQLDGNDSNNAINFGLKSMEQREMFEQKMPRMMVDSPSFRHQLSMKTSEAAKKLMKIGFVLEMGAKHLANSSGLTNKLNGNVKWFFNASKWLPSEVCSAVSATKCVQSPYRTADGTCNNILHPDTWGVAMRPFRRVIPPDYADGISSPRASPEGDLPSAREVSLNIHRAIYKKDLDFTVMLAVWGQFVDHDMTATALSQGIRGEPISCCQNKENEHPECFAVLLGSEDPFYKEFKVTCMEFVRSAPAPQCISGTREQLNQASSYIDGSAIYGNTKSLTDRLRTFSGGELKMLKIPSGEELLPQSTDINDGCNRIEQFKRGRYCFLTGDMRSNENLHLISMHLIFARQHNAVARKLLALNRHWNDEKLFQETRKIIIAQIQHITYKEFLPTILQTDLMNFLNLTVHSKNYNYNSSINPSIANSFAASVFRFGHSLLPGLMKMIDNNSVDEEYVELHKMLFNPFGLYDEEFLENILRGALNTSMEKSDVHFSEEITTKLFQMDEKKKGPCGLDLVSLNIQRGRDHGLPAYPRWRHHCQLKDVNFFEDLDGIFDNDSLNKLKTLYKSVADIDLFTGGLSEIPLNGSLLGPTFTCLLADQFLRLKMGDRYWYETEEEPQAFTSDLRCTKTLTNYEKGCDLIVSIAVPAAEREIVVFKYQLKEIKKTSLARIICDNSYITKAQPMVMKRVKWDNKRQSCRHLPNPNFDFWKE